MPPSCRASRTSTYVLHDIAPHERALRSLRIARAFTAYHHYTLVKEVVRQASPNTDLVIAPCLSSLYRDPDLADYRRPPLLESAMAMLYELGTTLDIPVLVTDSGPNDDLATIVESYVDHEIACVKTDFGFRYETDDFQTTV